MGRAVRGRVGFEVVAPGTTGKGVTMREEITIADRLAALDDLLANEFITEKEHARLRAELKRERRKLSEENESL